MVEGGLRTRTECGLAVCLAILSAAPLASQEWDLPARAAAGISRKTENRLKISADLRGRYERRTGQAFGRDPDLETALFRNRLSLSYKPAAWFRLTGTVQDSRAPGYGPNAPNSVRNQADLLESCFELFPDRQRGFGMTAGRMMLRYGESRLLATAQWGNVTRSFDHARLYWRSTRGQVEFLWLSPVKARVGEFDRPALGERVWGTYNSFPNLFGKNLVEIYALRHEQNRPGGFTGGSKADGTDHLGVNTFGGRLAGPLSGSLQYSLEGAVQTGKVGAAKHRAAAWYSSLARRWMLFTAPLDLAGGYKYASGTRNPEDASRTGSFDPLFPSAHDKFGHMDLFAWRNIHYAYSLATLGLSSSFAVNFMYNSFWLASRRDALYNSSGKAVARSATGAAGRHIGQETDVFATYRYRRLTFGAGFGYMFAGQFLKLATPGVAPTYFYVFHSYSL
jgi:hypothetical protein